MAFDAGSIESALTLDRTPFNAGLQQARADAEKLTRRRFQVKLGLDATALDREWERFRRNHRGLDITLDLAFKAATGELSAWRAAQERVPVRVPVEINTRAAVRGMEVFRARQASRELVLPLEVDTEHARRQVETFRRVTGGGLSLPIKPELESGAGAWAPPRMRQMGETIAEQMSRGFLRSRRPESAAERVAQRMNRRASALVGVAWFAALPAAAAVAAAGAAAAVAVVPAAFTAIGAAAVASSAEVKDAYSDLWGEVKATTREAAAPIEDTLIGIAERVGDTYQGIAPQLSELFAASQAPAEEFVDGLLNLAITALPGMTQAAQDSMPIMQGWNRLLTQIGGGLGDLFALSASGGPAVIGTMDTLGGIVRDLLATLGQLFANLATNGGPALADFRGILQQVYGILLELTGDGFGLLGSAVAGFTDVLSTALTLVRAFLEAVGGWGGPILYAVGALKALNMITFGRLGGQFDMITGKVKDAEGWGGKIAAGLRGGLIGAAVTGGLMLVNELVSLFTRQQRIAEQGARQNRDAQERYNQALAKTAGLLTEVSRAEILNSDLGKRAAANVRELGYDYETFVQAVTRGGDPVNDILATNEERFRELIALTGLGLQPQFVESFRELADNGQGAAAMLDQINTLTQRYGDQLRRMGVPQDVVEQRQAWFREELTRVLDLQSEFGSLANAADEYAHSQAAASAEVRAMTPAQIEAEVAARALSESMEVLADTTSSADEKASALIATLDVLSGRHPDYEEAMQGFNDLIRRTADGMEGGSRQGEGVG